MDIMYAAVDSRNVSFTLQGVQRNTGLVSSNTCPYLININELILDTGSRSDIKQVNIY